MRTCSKCRDPKPLDEFDFVNRATGKRSSWCKPCARKKVKEYQETAVAKARRREYQMRTLYNTTVEECDRILAAQGGVCAICKSDKAGRGRRFYVDHDHGTGIVRGLLCNSCNRALGLFQDSLGIIRSAVSYMENHQ